MGALGKLGHLDAAEALVKVAQGQNQEEPMVRVLAVQSLKRTARKYPNVLRPILLAIVNNPVEHSDVRIAAIDILPLTSFHGIAYCITCRNRPILRQRKG